MEKKINLVLIPMLFLLLICLVLIFVTPVWGDELIFHFPNAQNISIAQILDKNSSYSSAYTPIPFFVGNVIYKMTNSIIGLRIFNFAIFLTLAYFLYKIAEQLKLKPLLFVLLVISNPYILRSAYTYHMTNYGLLFSIIAIYFYFFSTGKYKLLTAHIFLGLAVLSQQWMILIICSIYLYEIISFFKKSVTKEYLFKSLLFKTICMIPALFLFYKWGGLTHPNFQVHALKPNFEHLNGVLANLGLAGMFIVLFNFKKFIKYQYIPLILILPVILLTIPAHSKNHGLEVITGVAAQLSTQLSRFLFVPYKFSMLIMILTGVLLLVLILLKSENNFFKYVVLGFIVALTSSAMLGASHIFVTLPFLFLLFADELKEYKLMHKLITVQLYLISIFYMFYYSFILAADKAL